MEVMTNRDEIEAAVIEELGNIAPDIDASAADRNADLREEFDIDSMDFLNLVIALHERLGVEIPEVDYPKLASIAGAVSYLDGRVAAS
jgi:acyl carrier protein